MPRRARIVGAGDPMHADELGSEVLERLRDCTNGGFVVGRPQFERPIAAMVGRRTWKGSLGRPPEETDVGTQTESAFSDPCSVAVCAEVDRASPPQSRVRS
jgi:hypothetical protein